MKRLVLALSMFLLVEASGAVAQPAAPAPPDRARILSAAREVMKKARYASLVTLAADGQPQARIIDPADPEPDLTVWIATNPATRKVGELRANPRATLFYFNRATGSYVTLLGSATLVTEPAEKARHWQAKWASHYPEGPRGASLTLIRFTARSLEIVSAPHKLTGDPKTWRPVVLELK